MLLRLSSYGFPMWACKTLNLPRPDGDMDAKEAIAPHVYRMYVNLLDMGKLLQVAPCDTLVPSRQP